MSTIKHFLKQSKHEGRVETSVLGISLYNGVYSIIVMHCTMSQSAVSEIGSV